MGWVQCILCCGQEQAVVAPTPQRRPNNLQTAPTSEELNCESEVLCSKPGKQKLGSCPTYAVKSVVGHRFAMEDSWAVIPDLLSIPNHWTSNCSPDRLPPTPSGPTGAVDRGYTSGSSACTAQLKAGSSSMMLDDASSSCTGNTACSNGGGSLGRGSTPRYSASAHELALAPSPGTVDLLAAVASEAPQQAGDVGQQQQQKPVLLPVEEAWGSGVGTESGFFGQPQEQQPSLSVDDVVVGGDLSAGEHARPSLGAAIRAAAALAAGGARYGDDSPATASPHVSSSQNTVEQRATLPPSTAAHCRPQSFCDLADTKQQQEQPQQLPQQQQQQQPPLTIPPLEQSNPASAAILPTATAPPSPATIDPAPTTPVHFFAIYDGHGGADVAAHCAKHLHAHLRTLIEGAIETGTVTLPPPPAPRNTTSFVKLLGRISGSRHGLPSGSKSVSRNSMNVSEPLPTAGSGVAGALPAATAPPPPCNTFTAAAATLEARVAAQSQQQSSTLPTTQAAAATTGGDMSRDSIGVTDHLAAAAAVVGGDAGLVGAGLVAVSTPSSITTTSSSSAFPSSSQPSIGPTASLISPTPPSPGVPAVKADAVAQPTAVAPAGATESENAACESEADDSGETAAAVAAKVAADAAVAAAALVSAALALAAVNEGVLLESSLLGAFAMVDNELHISRRARDVGTTAVVALLGPQHVWVANCGDSRAILCRNGLAVPLSLDHKATRRDEIMRVEAAGGYVWFDRVMGELAVSRAIGDHCLRPYVIAVPDITRLTRHAGDTLLILASDGLWDVCDNQDVCGIALHAFKAELSNGSSGSRAVRAAARALVKAALGRGTQDNVTALVVDLRLHKHHLEHRNSSLSTPTAAAANATFPPPAHTTTANPSTPTATSTATPSTPTAATTATPAATTTATAADVSSSRAAGDGPVAAVAGRVGGAVAHLASILRKTSEAVETSAGSANPTPTSRTNSKTSNSGKPPRAPSPSPNSISRLSVSASKESSLQAPIDVPATATLSAATKL